MSVKKIVFSRSEPIGNPEKFYGRLYEIGDSLAVTVPKTMIHANGWKKGTKLVLWAKKLDVVKGDD